MLKDQQTWTVEFTTADPTTGAATDADSTPTGTLVVNGVDDAASVTVTNITTGRYKASVTLPAGSSGDIVEMVIDATVSTVAGSAVVAREVVDAYRTSEVYEVVSHLSSGSAAISVPPLSAPDGFVLTTGTNEVNDEDSTNELNDVVHSFEDDGGTSDGYYIFSVGGSGVPVQITWDGYVNANGDTFEVYAWNWSESAWEQIGHIDGASGSTIIQKVFDVQLGHVGTGANIGKVHIRFYSTDGTKFATDRILCSYSVVAQSVGYADGRIWVDTVNGTAGTEVFVNGTADNPVSTWADALTLNTTLGLNRFYLNNGSSITLTGSVENYDIEAWSATIALNGQSCGGCLFTGASITGNDSGSNSTPVRFKNCTITTNTLGKFRMNQCALTGTLTLAEAGTCILEGCLCAGSTPPVIDYAAVGASVLNLQHWSGAIEVHNLGASDVFCVEGDGSVILDSSCTDGTAYIRGNLELDDSSDGTTVEDDARVDQGQIEDAVWDAVLSGSSHNDATSAGKRLRQVTAQVVASGSTASPYATVNTITLDENGSSTDGAYDPALIFIETGTGAGQCRLIIEYDGDTKTAVVDRDWKVNPDDTSTWVIIGSIGREHVNEGLAQAGTSDTITLNALASSEDNAYNGQIIFIRSGTGEDQARRVASYVGSTKVATMCEAWDVTPDATSGYVMLPTGMIHKDWVAEAVLDAVASSYEESGSIGALIALLTAINSAVSGLGSGAAVVQAPLASDGTIYFYQGDDYYDAEARLLEFEISDADKDYALDTATEIQLRLKEVTVGHKSVTETDDGWTLAFEITSTITGALTLLRQGYKVRATLLNGHVVTVATGTARITEDIDEVT